MTTTSTLEPGDTGAICQTCKFWDFDSDKDQDESGRCRRRAPVPTVTASTDPDDEFASSYFVWPITNPGDWCGEWAWDGLSAKTDGEA